MSILLLISSFVFGFFFLALAMRDIPLEIAYAVWTGLGAVGVVLAGILFFKEEAGLKRLFSLLCIIVGAAGLKLIN